MFRLVLLSLLSFASLLSSAQVAEKAKKVKMIISDVEHVLASSVHVNSSGEQVSYTVSLKDQAAIRKAKDRRLNVVLLTENSSSGLATWAEKQGVNEVIQEAYSLKSFSNFVDSRKKLIHKIASKYFISLSEIAYISDDPTAIEALKIVGFPCCTSNADGSIKNACTYVSLNQSNAFSDIIDALTNAS